MPNSKDTEDQQLFTDLPRYHTLMVMLLGKLRASVGTTKRPKGTGRDDDNKRRENK